VIAVADRGTMLDASSIFYMNKLVTGPEGVGVCDIRKPVGENIRALAKAKNKSVSEIVVAVLDRPRHEDLIREIREAGAGTRLLLDGDVAASIHASSRDSRIDMCLGVGGSPEGVVTACAVTALGGLIQGILMPRDEQEKQKGIVSGLKMDYVYEAHELVRSDNTFFIATGVTDGQLLEGVRRKGPMIRTESVIIRGRSGTIRRIIAEHQASRWS
jgi:fructose-1,6-bisphosphatase II